MAQPRAEHKSLDSMPIFSASVLVYRCRLLQSTVPILWLSIVWYLLYHKWSRNYPIFREPRTTGRHPSSPAC